MDHLHTSAALRKAFLQYFKERGHRVVDSSPVIPHDDPTLLFNNAGMNQFKDFFLGKLEPPYATATTAQKCIRVGGKHNDLENVGHTRRHLTFFEMLGNFSFGDYFKAKAISFAWELSTEVFGFPPDRIWPSIYEEDEEAFELWRAFVPEKRIVRFGKAENFWEMGESGPCGPCSELLFDRGPAFGAADHPHKDPSGERYLEFWNLVFMQYNRGADGVTKPLPLPSIDTGAGLERVAMLKMGTDNVFETDILRSLIARVEELSSKKYLHNTPLAPAFQVIADHIRTLAFAIADGAQPSNTDRGYVLRKVLRRAVRYARQLGLDKPFMAELVPALIATMGEHFTELKTAESRICELLTSEEESFLRTLQRGGGLLSGVIESAKHSGVISGDDAFKLKDTYGLPLEEIALLAKDSNLKVDLDRFHLLEDKAREIARAAHKKTAQVAITSSFENARPSTFVGYRESHARGAITALFVDDMPVQHIERGAEALIITGKTPFYAQMGGQVGDSGEIRNRNALFSVTNTLAPYTGIIAHKGVLKEGSLKVGEEVSLHIDEARRQQIRCHHSATHLLHWALEKKLGAHVRQAGSLVECDRLRFDFNHHKPLTRDEVAEVEQLVNTCIQQNSSVDTAIQSFEVIRNDKSVKQFFADKYEGDVRVVTLGPSKELCGGTHVQKLGELGLFKIVKESSVASGVRRIEAVCAEAGVAFVRILQERLYALAEFIGVPEAKLEAKLTALVEETKTLKEHLKKLESAVQEERACNLATHVAVAGDIPYVIALADAPAKELKNLTEAVLGKMGRGIVALGCTEAASCQIAVKVSKDLVAQGTNAKELLASALEKIGGRGGGSPEFATGAGSEIQFLQAALDAIKHRIL